MIKLLKGKLVDVLFNYGLTVWWICAINHGWSQQIECTGNLILYLHNRVPEFTNL